MYKVRSLRLLSGLLASIILLGSLVTPRAYGELKLYIVAITMILALKFLIVNKKSNVKIKSPIIFFSFYIFVNLVGLIIGAAENGFSQAIYDGFRLGVIFPVIIAILWTYLANFNFYVYFHKLIMLAAAAVSLILMISTFPEFGLPKLLADSFLDANLLVVGVHDGYVQILAHSVGSLFFIFGYLIYFATNDPNFRKSYSGMLVLALTFFGAMLSGRRALQFIVFLSPVLVILIGWLFGIRRSNLRYILFSWLLFCLIAIIIFAYFFANEYLNYDSFLARFSEVLNDDDGVRVSQASELIKGFSQNPIFGSGIGGTVQVIRNFERPWVYELTYHQMIFNFGLFGISILVIIFANCFYRIRSNVSHGVIYPIQLQAMTCGISFLMIGAISNPYLGSFDFLVWIGILPFASDKTWKKTKIVNQNAR